MPNYSSNNGTFHRNSSSYVEGGRSNFHEIGKDGEINLKGSKVKDEVLKDIKKEIPNVRRNMICKNARRKIELTKELNDIKKSISNDQRNDVGL